ncbi:hypothetical protein K493DRAFT_320715 [Basidiobolus meristosporus CBS 931.73]|uniref:Cyclin N-terminal domain-containing protein n=1 Tax=Basidiobolus meristosporus CBS 931.73 TaxID=1314790 RepID=A0A1Y1X7D9_9FUNG|nr:hypothetical protein K493DRAFT_320715 [Basidiobolus meristosporus CBS 931.73]|eukprot:ORX81254.1 hypothetical protein K493DRAFT_320715 [Basidiobolus meristosporus CBS 931.73]
MPGASIHQHPTIPKDTLNSATFVADVITHMWGNNPYGATAAFRNFCARLFQITQPSASTLKLALNYVYRYKETEPLSLGLLGTEYYIVVVALMLANKYHEDKCYSNRSWAKVSGLDLIQLSQMELAVLATFGWNIKVEKDEFDAWTQFLDQYWSAVIAFRTQHALVPEECHGSNDCRRQSFVSSESVAPSVL